MPLEPIIDAHHHIWRTARVPWLTGPMQPRIFGEYGAIRRDYLIEEYAADARPHGAVKSVYIQVNVAPGDEEEEVAWVQSVADSPIVENSGTASAAPRFPHGIIGYADLRSPGVARALDRECAFSRLRGIRQQLHWHENPLYRFESHSTIMNEDAFRNGLTMLAQHGLLFELQVFASQMHDAARLAADFPDVTFVLLHAGMLEDRSPEGWARWREGMGALAKETNVHVKLSGLGTFTRACSVELWRPVIEETLELFGAARCIFGSNFPIEKLWTSYGEIVSVTKRCLGALSQKDRRAVLHDNAERVYRI